MLFFIVFNFVYLFIYWWAYSFLVLYIPVTYEYSSSLWTETDIFSSETVHVSTVGTLKIGFWFSILYHRSTVVVKAFEFLQNLYLYYVLNS